jgi:hypothetical protein
MAVLTNFKFPPCLGMYINTGQTSNGLYQFCLRMGTEPVPETLYLLNHLTRLMAREAYIKFPRCSVFIKHNRRKLKHVYEEIYCSVIRQRNWSVV